MRRRCCCWLNQLLLCRPFVAHCKAVFFCLVVCFFLEWGGGVFHRFAAAGLLQEDHTCFTCAAAVFFLTHCVVFRVSIVAVSRSCRAGPERRGRLISSSWEEANGARGGVLQLECGVVLCTQLPTLRARGALTDKLYFWKNQEVYIRCPIMLLLPRRKLWALAVNVLLPRCYTQSCPKHQVRSACNARPYYKVVKKSLYRQPWAA